MVVTVPDPEDPGPAVDVVALGNAIVDVIAYADDAFLLAQDLDKGAMRLIDAAEAERLYGAMGPAIEASGGSAANTVAGIASFGGRAAFIGRVRDDPLGATFGHDIRAAGVHFDVPASPDGPPTARCLILVTPDAQRTMSTYLGIATHLTPDDVDADLVGRAAVTYCEGYLWDVDVAQQAILRAMDVARVAGQRVALTLSDAFCVERHRAEFLDLTADRVDILFANAVEICSLYQTEHFDAALEQVRDTCELAFLTRGLAGSVVVAGDAVHVVDPHPPSQLVDTTGAGDLYAAGVLYGLTAGLDVPTAAALGSLAAAEVISHVGARPARPLAALARSAELV
ncbi:adenosine kinase [soil metagenome]